MAAVLLMYAAVRSSGAPRCMPAQCAMNAANVQQHPALLRQCHFHPSLMCVLWLHGCMQQAAGCPDRPPAAYLAGSCLQLRDLLANVHAILLGHFTHLQDPCVTRAAMRRAHNAHHREPSLPP
jgi:hypothetical protein